MSRLDEGWINHLRNASRQGHDKAAAAGQTVKCPLCESDVAADLLEFRNHVAGDVAKHASLASDTDIEDAFRKITIKSSTRTAPHSEGQPQSRLTKKRPVSGAGGDGQDRSAIVPDTADRSQRESKRFCSPPASDTQQRGSSPPTPTLTPGHRNRGRTPASPNEFDRGYGRGQRPAGQLFNPNADQPRPKSGSGRHPQKAPGRPRSIPSMKAPPAYQPDPERPHTFLVSQPDTEPISHDQLVGEVKGIYTGLVMIEAKCIEVDTAQSSNTEHQPGSEQWQALIALHRTLLHEHHDFFLASQHPAASDALKRLPAKYAMPARMWRHGIHSFLELLRHRLPGSYDQMLTFIYMAYGLMALLYETVTAFEDTWVECLGDLARYRMAIEDTDIKDREIWTGVARSWYSLASEKAPTTGRLYHHLAILARPNAVQQLYFYTKSLCVPVPFPSARESAMTLFDPLFADNPPRLQEIDAAFVRVHAILFSGKHEDQLQSSMDQYRKLLDPHIGRTTKRWLETGYHTGIPLTCSLLGYGAEDHFLMKIIRQRPEQTDVNMEASSTSAEGPDDKFRKARSFMVAVYDIVVRRWGDPNTLPFLHTILAFMYHVSRYPAAMVHLEKEFPWKLTAVMLNYLHHSCQFEPRIDSEEFPGAHKNDTPRPLTEDFALQGLIYTEEYYPISWFRDSKVEEDEKYFELASMTDQRKERLLWLGRRLATSGQWLTWDNETRQFGVAEPYANDAEDVPLEDLDLASSHPEPETTEGQM